MFVELVETTHDLRIICGLMLFGFVGCVAFGLVQNYLGIGVNLYEFQDTGNTTYEDLGEKFTRVTGPFSNSTEMAQYLLIPLFLALGMVIDAKRWWVKAAMLVLFAAGGWVLLLTLTRCPIAAFAIVLGAVILRRTGPLVLTGMALVGFLLFYLGTEFPNLVDLLLPAGLGARSGDVSSDFFDIRIPLWTAAIDIFKQSPFFGIGFRNLLDPLPYYVPGANWLDFYRNTVGLSPIETLHEGHVQVDSTWFTWLPEMGAIGLGLVFFIVGRVVKNLYFLYRKSRDPEISSLAFAFGTGFVAVLINMIANYAYTNYGCGIMMWSCLGVSTVLGRMNANLEAPGAGFKAEARQKNPDPPVPQPV
jgi:O-antigen ligase